jgi:hypothetical protein
MRRQVLVVKDGRLVERGTHDELMASSAGLYRKLGSSWLGGGCGGCEADYSCVGSETATAGMSEREKQRSRVFGVWTQNKR